MTFDLFNCRYLTNSWWWWEGLVVQDLSPAPFSHTRPIQKDFSQKKKKRTNKRTNERSGRKQPRAPPPCDICTPAVRVYVCVRVYVRRLPSTLPAPPSIGLTDCPLVVGGAGGGLLHFLLL